MSIPTEFEEKMNIFIKEKNPDVSQGVDIGIKIEKMGIDFYTKSAEKAGEDVRHVFTFLAKQETQHLSLLKELKNSLIENDRWKEPGAMKSCGRIPKIFSKSKKYDYEISAMLHALEAERLSKKFYSNFAKKIKNPDGKRFFEKMAEFEEKHLELIKAILDSENFRMQS